MKPNSITGACLALALLLPMPLHAEEDRSSDIAALEKAATGFVAAYNKKDAAAIAALFAENGEIADLKGDDIASGRADVQARYEAIFAAPDAPSIAIEVSSVRFVGDGLAIEDGTAHLTPPSGNAPPRSFAYTAMLQKDGRGGWKIASTRDLGEDTGPAGRLAGLASMLTGEWTARKDGLRLDLAFGWDDSGEFLSGEMLATAADAPPQTTTIRIGWDAARKVIVWWTFDDKGGFSKGHWTPVDDGWLIRTEGTSAEGEATSATQQLSFENKDTFTWKARDRIVDGEQLPDAEWRVVRQVPEPSAE